MKEIVVVLNNIRSLHNVGSIFRTSDAFSVSKIYLCGITPKPQDVFGNFRREITKVALGAEKSIFWGYNRSALSVLKKLKNERYKIIGIEQFSKSVNLFKFKNSFRNFKKIALVLGNEKKGLSKDILDFCDKVLEIPMFGKKESLNVGVAFGIVAFHLRYLEFLQNDGD